MKTFHSIALFLIVLAGLTLSPVCLAGDEILNNASVIELQKLNLGDSVIIEKIKSSKCNFDTSIKGLMELKAANVSSPVMAAMLAVPAAAGTPTSAAAGNPNDPAAPHAAGLWVLVGTNGQNEMIQLPREVPAEISHGGFIGPFGIGKVATTARLTGMVSQMQLSPAKPEFYFYYKNTAMDYSDGGSPQQIVLAQFTVLNKDDKKNPNQRAVDVAVHGAYGGSYGVDRKAVRATDTTTFADEVFKIVPKTGLADGEYAFCVGSSVAAVTGQYQFYTFGIHSK